MADYVRNKFLDELRGEFADRMVFNDMSNVTPENILANMEEICEDNEIPACFSIVTVEISKGIFNKSTYNAVKVWHPNPPQSYCDQLYIIVPGNGVMFYWVGSSTAFDERKGYEAAMNGEGGGFKARWMAFAGIEPDSEPFEEEMEWHSTIYSVFCSLVE